MVSIFSKFCRNSLLLLIINQTSSATNSCQVSPLNLSSPQQEVADIIGWVENPCFHGYCTGFYQEPFLDFQQNNFDGIMQILAGNSRFVTNGVSELADGVKINRADNLIIADQVHLFRSNNKLDKIDLIGNLRLREQGRLIAGDYGYYDLTNDYAEINNALYRISLSRDNSEYKYIENQSHYYGLNAWGSAYKIKKLTSGDYELNQVSYTTCPVSNKAWNIRAQNIYLDQESGKGIAKHAIFEVKGIPIFYMPYYNFFLDNRRHTGFLMPLFGYSTNLGFHTGIPFYWNIAPNYDMTITPRINRRGLLSQIEFRYLLGSDQGGLSSHSEGNLYMSFLSNDEVYANFKAENPEIERNSNDRAAIFFEHETQFDNNWSINAIYNEVSDDYYPQDFSTNLSEATENQLLRKLSTNYTGRHWNFYGAFEAYQTLQPINRELVAPQYSKFPELILNANYPDIAKFIDLKLTSRYSYFYWPVEKEQRNKIQGHRFHLLPELSINIQQQVGFFTTKVGLHHTKYSLSGPFKYHSSDHINNDLQRNPSRNIPIFSIDTGLFFERNVSFFQQNFTQTLEPRVFYLYVPYEEQTHINSFDSGYYSFNYAQLFRTNRFSGIDRVGDTNQISLALTSKLLDSIGAEKFIASIGQIYYFQPRKVNLCAGNFNCSDEPKPEQIPRAGFFSANSKASPVAARAEFKIFPYLDLISDIAWDPYKQAINNSSVSLHYQSQNPDPIVFNINYSSLIYGDSKLIADPNPDPEDDKKKFIKETIDLNQIGFSYGVPLAKNWRSLGSARYNLNTNKISSAYFGIEHENCCWAVRLFGGRAFTELNQNNVQQYNNAIFIQFLLKGGSTISSDLPDKIIEKNINGYIDLFKR